MTQDLEKFLKIRKMILKKLRELVFQGEVIRISLNPEKEKKKFFKNYLTIRRTLTKMMNLYQMLKYTKDVYLELFPDLAQEIEKTEHILGSFVDDYSELLGYPRRFS